jgi:hypothetical protein
MTAIFTGVGAGFARGSATVLGGSGLLGSGVTGRGGDNLMVNAATGNLVINRQDEFLTGPSHDIAIGRTYNSLAEVHDGDNNDKWQMSTVRKVFGLTGTLNATGSKVKRQAGDGSVSTYDWATKGGVAAYWSSDGDGAHDKLVNASGVWTWTDGSSQYSEVYEAVPGDSTSWRIASYKDNAGAAQTFTYWSGTKLDKVIAANGEYIQYQWSGSSIVQINTGLADRTLTRTRYEYDGSGRLNTVKVDLSPDTAGISDGHIYTTYYEYGSNGLV